MMTDKEIRQHLEEFIERINYEVSTPDQARALDKEIDAFCEENNVSFEQMQVIAESGAGEALYMLMSMEQK